MRWVPSLALLVLAIVLALPSIIPSQPSPGKTNPQKQREIEQLRALRREKTELQRELINRRLIKQVEEQLPGVNIAKIRKQYRIPREPEFGHLPEVEIHGRIDQIDMQLPRPVEGQEGQGRIMNLYGDDNVKGIALTPPSSGLWVTDSNVLRVARSVVAIVDRGALKKNEGEDTWKLKIKPLATVGGNPLCEDERWYGAPSTEVCGTGFLVEDSVIATAGHVVQMGSDGTYSDFFKSVYFVFGYVMESENQVRTIFPDSLVYKGRRVLARRSEMPDDWALICLDRKVTGRMPLPYRKTGKVPDHDTRLYMIGHPEGLPQQYSGSASLLNNEPCSYFRADLDAFTYNSGSPVIRVEGNEHVVEGILVRDMAKYEMICECFVFSAWEARYGLPGADVTRSTEFAGTLHYGDSVLVQCNLDNDEYARITMATPDHVVWLSGGEKRVLPWDLYWSLLSNADTGCETVCSPKPGSVWAIDETNGFLEIEKVCFP